MTQGHRVQSVEPESIAAELGIEPGDILVSINGEEVRDIFDYRYLIRNEELNLLVRDGKTGEEVELEFEKDEDDDLGLDFGEGLMDSYRSCSNRCIFCFIDQLPKGMRETLYFKDDDARLSFLQGNYITLTNMKDEDLERIIRYRMQPINISVHTTNPELRVRMLGNRFAGEALGKIRRLYEAGMTMNGQIVLCRGINDGRELERTIKDLSAYLPYFQSLSVVPVGLTRFRDGLFPLEPFTKDDAIEVLRIIEDAQQRILKQTGSHFVHAGDEWYLLAERDIPAAETYDGYLQLENGVGMMRLLRDEFTEAVSEETPDPSLTRSCTVACGTSIAGFFRDLVKELNKAFPNVHVEIIPIRNDFFGERITVSGLLTGRDIIAQLTGRALGDELLLSSNLLRFGEDVLLDDLHISDIENALGISVRITEGGGISLLDGFLGR